MVLCPRVYTHHLYACDNVLHLHAEWDSKNAIFLNLKVHSDGCLVIPFEYVTTIPVSLKSQFRLWENGPEKMAITSTA